MFGNFCRFFGLPELDLCGKPAVIMMNEIQKKAAGFPQLLSVHGGASLGRGMYRLHHPVNIEKWNQILSESFPDFANRISCFGYDWLGRHFALDNERVVDGQPQVLMLEPGTGEVLEIPCSFLEFHNTEIPNYHEACLASEFFDSWMEGNSEELLHEECVGYKVPLFLGGEDTVSNLERSDMEVYWAVYSQLIQRTNDLPNGSIVDRIDFIE